MGVCSDKAEALLQKGQAEDRIRGELKSLRILRGIFTGQVIAVDEINSIYDVLSEEDDFLRSLLHFKMGVIHVMRGETAQAVDDFTETLRLSLALNNHLFSLMAYAGLGETCQVRGKLRLAEMAFQQAIGYAKEILGEHTVLLSIPYNSYADLLREQNRFAEAIDYAEIGIAYFQM